MKNENRKAFVCPSICKKRKKSVAYSLESSPPKFSIPSNFDEDDDEIMHEMKATSPQTFFDFDGSAVVAGGRVAYSVGESGVVGEVVNGKSERVRAGAMRMREGCDDDGYR